MYGLADLVHRHQERDGARRLALICGEEQLTYAELGARVRSLASGLAAAGFRRGDRCALLLTNRIEWLELLFAVAHLGGVTVPLNYLLKPNEVRFAVEDSHVGWIVSEESLWDGLAALEGDVQRVCVDAERSGTLPWTRLARGGHPPVEMVTVSTEDVCILQYTSGTTGFPKAAVHTHGTVLFNALAQLVDFGLGPDDVHLVVPALCWSAGLHCLTLSAFWRGATVVLRPTGNLTGPELCALIERRRPTSAMLAPSVLRIVLGSDAVGDHDLSSMRTILSGGEPVGPGQLADLRRWMPQARLMQGYGVSEFPTTMAYLEDDQVLAHDGAAGRPSVAATIRVVGADGRDLPAGEHGEVICRAPSVSSSYHTAPGAPPRSAVVDGWLRTGDRGWLDRDGFLHLAGRVSEMYLSGGLNVYPAEVERVLLTCPEVLEAAVVAVPDERYGSVGRAVVVLADGATAPVEELDELCRRELANYKVPRQWEVRTAPLPKTASGKVRKFLLARDAANADFTA